MKPLAVNPAWIPAVAQKDQKIFEQLFTLCKDNVYSVALAYLEDDVEAEAVVLEVFLRVWKAGDKLLEVADFSAWLYTITKNCALTALKREAIRRKREATFPELPDSTTPAVYEQDMQLILQAALDTLTPQQRKIFELSRLQGYDRHAIAKTLGIAPATVSAHLTIALNSIRGFLKKNAVSLIFFF